MMLKNFCSIGLGNAGLLALLPALTGIALGGPMGQAASAYLVSLSPDQLPHAVTGTAGGNAQIPGAIVPSAHSSAECLGSASFQANHQIQFETVPSSLTITVDSFGNTDTTLAIQTPDGEWLCGDDISSTNKDAAITIGKPTAGTYQVWVGTFDGGYADYELTLD